MEGDPEGREVEDHPAGHHNEYEGIPVAEEYDYVHLKVSLPQSAPRKPPGEQGSRPEVPEADPGFLHSFLSLC